MVKLADCGLMFEPQLGMSTESLLSCARQTEDLGFGYMMRSDHLLPTNGSSGLDSSECWSTLGAIAVLSKNLRFGPLVSPVGFRNPALLAKMACTLHSLSDGRFQLALGAGWYEREYTALGYPFPEFKERRRHFEEALSIILPLVLEGKVDFDGRHYTAHTDCYPRPKSRMHVIIGAGSKSMIRIAARKADEWNTLATTDEQYKERKSVLEEASGGRSLVSSIMGPFLLGRDGRELERNAKKQLAKFGQAGTPEDVFNRFRARGALVGTPDVFAERVRAMERAGVNRFYFQVLVPENVEMTELLMETIKSQS